MSVIDRRNLFKAALATGITAAAAGPAAPAQALAITHPGLLHTKADLDRIAARVNAGAQPWKAGWDRLRFGTLTCTRS